MRQLAYQVIDIGSRVLSAKLHPDKGGSSEAMARVEVQHLRRGRRRPHRRLAHALRASACAVCRDLPALGID